MIYVISHRAKQPTDGTVIDTTSHSENWSRGLSPFYLGPIELYGGFESLIFENAYQYSKCYQIHTVDGEPTPAYFEWARKGWADSKPKRYPMGRGAKPLYSLWNGEKLDYISARKRIYCPLYSAAVEDTDAYRQLQEIYGECQQTRTKLYLRDYDGYDHRRLGMTLQDVLNNPNKKMGHAFVLLGLLENNKPWMWE